MTVTKAQLLYALIATSVLTLSSLPALGDPRDDGYPFSTYPMFGGRRKTPTFYKAEGQDAHGTWQAVPPELFGTHEVMQAVMTVQRRARAPHDARKMCRDLMRAQANRYEKIRIVRAIYDPVKYFTEGPKPQSSTVLAQCSKSKDKKTDQKGRLP